MKRRFTWRMSATFFAVGCTHIVKVPSECAPSPQPTGRSAIGWERIAGASRVYGRVASPSLSPLHGATIGLARLSVSPLRERVTTSNGFGEFSFDSLPPDLYLLRVRSLGYALVSDTLKLTADSGIVATVLLVQHNLIFDECSLTYTERRVPWWHH
jgi:carboxypeptidase family protein